MVITEQKLVGSTTWGKTAKGWISMDYVKLDSDGNSEPSEPEDEEMPATMVRTVNVSCLLVRSGAGTGYSQVGYLYRGAKVTVTDLEYSNGAEKLHSSLSIVSVPVVSTPPEKRHVPHERKLAASAVPV